MLYIDEDITVAETLPSEFYRSKEVFELAKEKIFARSWQLAATIEEVYKEMKRLNDEPVGEQELQLVRNYMMGTILGDLDGPFHIIARWKNYILNGLDGNYFYKAIETIRTVSAEELQQLAKKYLNPDEFYELVVV